MGILDKESFLAGLQLGRRIKVLDTIRGMEPQEQVLQTETEIDILTEDEEEILVERQS